jgi:ketosteroid isomerase-like protein
MLVALKGENAMSQRDVDTVKGAYEAFGRGDIPAVLEVFDPAIEWILPDGAADTSGTFRGHEAVVSQVFMPLPQNWNGFAVVPQQFIDGGDWVIVSGRMNGTGKTTGQAFHIPFVHTCQMRNGKVVRFEEFFDTATYNRAFAG